MLVDYKRTSLSNHSYEQCVSQRMVIQFPSLLVATTQREGGLDFAPGHEPMLPPGFRSSSRILVQKQMKVCSRLPAKSEKIVGRSDNKPWDAQGSQCTKTKIVYFENAFHGRSMGTLSVTTNPKYLCLCCLKLPAGSWKHIVRFTPLRRSG